MTHVKVIRFESKLLGVAVLIAVCVSLSGPAPAQGASTPNANSIACPNAPAGWTSPAGLGGRTVLSPNPLDATTGLDDLKPGITQVTIICGYFKNSTARVVVTLNYALPTADFNPYADFDVGCDTKVLPVDSPNGDYAWNTKARKYRVVSLTRWSYASFSDPLQQLAAGDVAAFKAVARSLLARSTAAAHDCTLPGKGKPTAPPPKTWAVDFFANVTSNGHPVSIEVNTTLTINGKTGTAATSPKGAFDTASVLTGSPSDVTQLAFPDLTVTFQLCGADVSCVKAAIVNGTPLTQTFALHPGASALAFSTSSKTGSTTLEFPVSVTSSTYPQCSIGDTGTLTLTQSTADTVVLDICGAANFLQPDPGTSLSGILVTFLPP